MGIVGQLEAVIDGLDVEQARAALKAVVVFCAGDDTGAGEALFVALAAVLGAPGDEAGYANWLRTRAAVEGRA